MIEFDRFRVANALLSREQFLENFPTPWLLTSSLTPEEGVSFTTAKWIPGSQPQSGPRVLFPVEKQPERNAFPLMVTLGRALNNDIIIADSRVSSFHAFFREQGEEWMVFDAKSQNGTQVGNGPRLEPEQGEPLQSGSLITLGRSLVLEFLDPASLYDRLRAT